MTKHYDLKKVCEEMGIDVPVMATRMVGDRLELHLYGGVVVRYPPTPTIPEALEKMKVKDLKGLAAEGGILGYMAMRKDDLVAALERKLHPEVKVRDLGEHAGEDIEVGRFKTDMD